jgi:hypothetical protein
LHGLTQRRTRRHDNWCDGGGITCNRYISHRCAGRLLLACDSVPPATAMLRSPRVLRLNNSRLSQDSCAAGRIVNSSAAAAAAAAVAAAARCGQATYLQRYRRPARACRTARCRQVGRPGRLLRWCKSWSNVTSAPGYNVCGHGGRCCIDFSPPRAGGAWLRDVTDAHCTRSARWHHRDTRRRRCGRRRYVHEHRGARRFCRKCFEVGLAARDTDLPTRARQLPSSWNPHDAGTRVN